MLFSLSLPLVLLFATLNLRMRFKKFSFSLNCHYVFLLFFLGGFSFLISLSFSNLLDYEIFVFFSACSVVMIVSHCLITIIFVTVTFIS